MPLAVAFTIVMLAACCRALTVTPLVDTDLQTPSTAVLSEDGSTLYVADLNAHCFHTVD
ncbi:unnamed protein product, partial [marine sediment metagenome]